MSQATWRDDAQIQCPRCGSDQVNWSIRDAENSPLPSISKAILIWVPVGFGSLFMLLKFGLGSGFGLWILGMGLGIANPLYAILQRRKWGNRPASYAFECRQCRHTWEKQAQEPPR